MINIFFVASSIIQKKVEYDLGTLLANVLETFRTWEAERSMNIMPAEKFVEEKKRVYERVSS